VTDRKSGKIATIAYEDALKVRKDGLPTAAKIDIGAGVVAGTMMIVGVIAYKAAGY